MKLNFKNVAAIIVAIGITIFIAVYFTNSRHLNGMDSYLDESSTQSNKRPSEIQPAGQAPSKQAVPSTPSSDSSDVPAKAGDKGLFIDPNRVYTEEWAEKKIEEHKDEIAKKDLEDFKNIIEEIGSDEIKEDMKGGFSEEEQYKLYSEMKDKLTKEEYERARALFEKYSWILSEE